MPVSLLAISPRPGTVLVLVTCLTWPANVCKENERGILGQQGLLH